ncbi:MAG: head GIN domain-containing protein [Saprospiraceae bacterium]
MKKLIVLLLLTTSILSSCENFTQKEEKEGSGNVITQQSEAGSFDAINVSDGLNVYVIMGEKENIEVQADDNLMEYIKTEVNSGTLSIYVDDNVNLDMDNVKINVTAVELSQINASAGSDVVLQNTIKSELFSCDVSSAADVKLLIETENLSVNASSSGEVNIQGKADEVSLNASSAGEIDGEQLKAINCKAQASSGGNVDANVSGDLTAYASSGGKINYSGNPTIKEIETSSGGSVNKN